MRIEGIQHVTEITGDAPGNVDLYVRVLGLRLVKKTVNQDDPTVYHLFYADEVGSAGSDLTFFEYPGAIPGRAGAGMVHRITWRVASPEALDFWADRLGAEGIEVERDGSRLGFPDPEGMYYMGRSMAHVGEPDTALLGLTSAVDRGFFCYPFFVRDPWLDPVRGDARFIEVLRRAEGKWREAKRAFDEHPGSRVLSVG